MGSSHGGFCYLQHLRRAPPAVEVGLSKKYNDGTRVCCKPSPPSQPASQPASQPDPVTQQLQLTIVLLAEEVGVAKE